MILKVTVGVLAIIGIALLFAAFRRQRDSTAAYPMALFLFVVFPCWLASIVAILTGDAP